MSFDLLAPHYRWMEWILAGEKLQRCRGAFLRAIPPPQSALLLGEGNGRFLVELLRVHPQTRVTCLDASAAMLRRARQNVRRYHGTDRDVEFVHADALAWSPPRGEFDLVVSNFFLDCFPPELLGPLVSRVAAAAKPGARWLIADFREPARGWQKWRAQVMLRAMYCFFRRVTHLPATSLTPPEPWLVQNGFVLGERNVSEWGLLQSDCWMRQGDPGSPSPQPAGRHAPDPALAQPARVTALS